MNLKITYSLFGAILFAGCSTPNLVFVDHNKIAIAIGASVPDQKADLTVGYESHSVALVPTIQKKGLSDSNQLLGTDCENGKKDALSTFASFKSLGEGKAGDSSFQLGRVFATGIAAQTIAEKYSDAAKAESQAKLVKEVNAETDPAKRQALQKKLNLQ